jgi:hypothetical protein
MKSYSVCLLGLLQLGLVSAMAQKSPTPNSPASAQQVSQPTDGQAKPGPEMEKLLAPMCGKWIWQLKYEPTEERPDGGTGEGEVVIRPGPGGLSMLADSKVSGPEGETSGISVTWWDAKAQGYRAIWCSNRMPGGCIVMSRLAKWEGKDFVLGDESTKDGKKFIFREVVSEITPNSFTQTLSRGEQGKGLQLLVTIHAIRSSEAVTITPAPESK